MMQAATGLYLWFLTTFGYGGITLPWGTVYLRPDRVAEAGLRAHEQVHLDQIKRDGPFVWAAKYLWYNARYGYAGNPYELEAQKVSGVK